MVPPCCLISRDFGSVDAPSDVVSQGTCLPASWQWQYGQWQYAFMRCSRSFSNRVRHACSHPSSPRYLLLHYLTPCVVPFFEPRPVTDGVDSKR